MDVDLAFREHGPFVFRVLRRLGVAEPLLDDAVQEVFLVVHRKRRDFDPRFELRVWLFGISRKVAARSRRLSERARSRHGRPRSPSALEPRTPEDQAATRESFEFLRRFLDDLGEPRGLVFVLHQLEGMTMPEVAEALGLKLNTAYSHLRLARAALREAVAQRDRSQRAS